MRIAVPTRVFGFIAIALIAIGIIGCHSYAPNAGHEIVLIKKPIFFGHGGVDPNPVRTGRTYAAISTDGVDVNMQPQKFDTELPDTMTKDGVPITFHAIMVLKVTALKTRNQSEMILQWYLCENDNRELNGEKTLIELIAPVSRTFIDVGANVGDWTKLFMHAGGLEKRGILIEPSRSAYARLEKLFGEDARVQLIHAAASETEGEAVFHEEKEAGETSSLLGSWCSDGAESVSVRVTTVDQEVAKTDWAFVDVLKIDAEGYDLHVIRGTRRLLSEKAVGILQFEYNGPWANAGSTLSSAITFLEGNGYKVFLVRSTGLHPLNYARWGEFYRCSNFVAVSPQSLSLVSPLLRSEL